MSKRLAMLEHMVRDGTNDPFAWYGLALEYKSLGRHDEAIATFEQLHARRPDYLPMYLIAGQLMLDLDRPGEARPWLEQGIDLARRTGDSKALGELEAALEDCDAP